MDKDSNKKIIREKNHILTTQNWKLLYVKNNHQKNEKSNDKLGTLFSTIYKNKGIIYFILCLYIEI